MVVYRELSSLCHDLGYSAKALYSLSNTIDRHYHEVQIPKRNGEIRTLHVPDEFLKAVGRSIVRNLLAREPISVYAKAYYTGGSTLKSASPHIGASTILKLDIRQFFDHITYPMVKERVFTEYRYSEANRILLSVLCVYRHCTPQGATTSPVISNIILREFDDRLGTWCQDRGITYTRYCDDMTFSGDFIPMKVIEYVRKELYKEGFFLNDKKTTILHGGQRKEVTGIVVNEKASIPKDYKKKLRQEIYYCKKYGAESHMMKISAADSEESYIRKLLGRVNYVLSIEKNNEEFYGYKLWLTNQMRA